MTVRELLKQANKQLFQSTNPALDAEVLLSFVLKKPKEYLWANPDKNLSRYQEQTFLKLAASRAKGMPVAYLTGGKEFYGREFLVNENVLIPRPDTEGLIDIAATYFGRSSKVRMKVLDIGTGSGCIIITLAKQFPYNHYFGSDVSSKALAVAKKNSKRLRAKITFKQSDLLAAWQKEPFDIIVANLPYGWKAWKDNASAETIGLKFEPSIALFTQDNGLYLIKKLLTQISNLQLQPALVVLEFDPRQKSLIKKLANKYLPAYKLQFVKDLSKRVRFLVLAKKSS